MRLKNMEMKDSISDDGILLRKLTPEDKNVIFEIYSNEASSRLDDWHPMKSDDEADKFIKESYQGFTNKSELKYGIVDRQSEKLVGCCGIFGLDEHNDKCILFYQVHHNERNKGYATRAISVLTKYVFEELECNRLEAYITPGNDGSIRVLEKNGFIYEGLLRQMEFYKGRFWDGIVMAMLRSDFEGS